MKYSDQNALHYLIQVIKNNDYDKVSQCIKILLENGVSPNTPNEKSETPFYLLLKEQKKNPQITELVDYCLDNYYIDCHSYRSKQLQDMLFKQNPNRTVPAETQENLTFDLMLNLLLNKKEAEFLDKFSAFQKSGLANGVSENDDNNLKEQYHELLGAAVNSGLEDAVERLLQENIDINKPSKFNASPAFSACLRGYHKVLKKLLEKPDLEFFCKTKRRSLLHEICRQFGTREIGEDCSYLECFNLLIEDSRALDTLNMGDDIGNTPLHYAIQNRSKEATIKILEKSAFIGARNNFGELAISEISHDDLEEILDGCVSLKDGGDSEKSQLQIQIDYNFLKSPKYPKGLDQEMAPLNYIDECSDLRDLIKHPVLSSFLYLKWQKLSLLFYANLLVFTIFLISFITYVVFCDAANDHENEHKIEKGAVYSILYAISVLGILIITLREILQFIFSRLSYIKSFINWCEVIFIILAWIVLLKSGMNEESSRVLRALVILCAAGEFLLLVGKLPFLSISTYMVILTEVWKTFWRSFALYCIPVIAFAMSFYSLFGGTKKPVDGEGKKDEEEDTFNRFGYPGIAIIKT